MTMIIAIAQLVDGNSVLGYRLLETQSKMVRDLNVQTLIDVVGNNKLSVANIKVQNGKLIGYNGSLDRLPKFNVRTNQLIGKSPLIVLKKLGSWGFSVSDFKGTVLEFPEDDVIGYAEVNGIANGKVVTRENGTQFISAIEGTYPEIKIEAEIDTQSQIVEQPDKRYIDDGDYFDDEEKYDVADEDDEEDYDSNDYEMEDLDATGALASTYRGKYAGSLLVNEPPLKPIICSEQNKYSQTYVTYSFNTKDNKLEVDRALRLPPIMYKDIKVSGFAYDTNYTFACTIRRSLHAAGKTYEELRDLFRNSVFRNKVDSMINRDYNYDIEISENVLHNQRTMDLPLKHELDEYLLYINKSAVVVNSTIEVPIGNLVMYRSCGGKGIHYKVMIAHGNMYKEIKRVKLEDIIAQPSDYLNVHSDDEHIKIVGLDGTYVYNIQEIYREYGRYVQTSSMAKRNRVLDGGYEEVLDSNGELHSIKFDKHLIVIPKDATSLREGCINLSPNNTELWVHSNVQQASSLMFKGVQSRGQFRISKIKMDANPTVGLNVIKSMQKLSSFEILDGLELQIIFSRMISPQEYVELFFLNNIRVLIKANNYEGHLRDMHVKILDGFAVKALSYIYEKKLDSFKAINEGEFTSKKKRNSMHATCRISRDLMANIRNNQGLQAKTVEIIERLTDGCIRLRQLPYKASRGRVIY